MKMKAAVMHQPGQISVESVELQKPQAGEVLVKMAATGICHSDVHYYVDDMPIATPVVLGHEGAGVIAELGPGVQNYEVGDHVVLSFFPACGQCRWCQNGQSILCDQGQAGMRGTMPDGSRRLQLAGGEPLNHFLFISTWAEYSVVPTASLIKVDAQAALDRLCLLGCGFTTGFGTATNAIRISPGESVVIVGCGGVGLSAVQGAALSGAGQIIAVDIHESKLAEARRFGATHGVQMRGDIKAVISEIKKICGKLGADYGIELVGGAHMAQTAAIAYYATRKGGTVCLVGVGRADIKSLPIDPLSLVSQHKTIKGVFYGEAHVKNDIPRYVTLYQQGKIDLDSMVSRELALEDIQSGIEAVISGNEVIRQVIRFDG